LLCVIFTFVCTSVGLLTPGESPIEEEGEEEEEVVVVVVVVEYPGHSVKYCFPANFGAPN
jgi:hypothetical protein